MSKAKPTLMYFGLIDDQKVESYRKRPYNLESSYYYNSLNKFRHKKFLVVDDDEICILLTAPILKSWNISFDIARDGKEAIEMLEKKEYDIALLDINMPFASGIEIAQTVKFNKKHKNHNAILIAITSNTSPKVRQGIQESGFASYITKPVNRDLLYEKILECIDKNDRES